MEHVANSRALWTLPMGADSLVRPRIAPQALCPYNTDALLLHVQFTVPVNLIILNEDKMFLVFIKKKIIDYPMKINMVSIYTFKI